MDQTQEKDHQSYLHVAIRDPAVYEAGVRVIADNWTLGLFFLFSAKPALQGWIRMKRDKDRIVPGFFLNFTTMRGQLIESCIFGRVYPALRPRH